MTGRSPFHSLILPVSVASVVALAACAGEPDGATAPPSYQGALPSGSGNQNGSGSMQGGNSGPSGDDGSGSSAGSSGSGNGAPGSSVDEGGDQNGQLPVDSGNSGQSGGNQNGGGGAGGSAGVDPGTGNAGGGQGMAGGSMVGQGGQGMDPFEPPQDDPPPDNDPPPENDPPPLPTPPGDAFFFDDFEGGAPGTQPAAWDRWINYTNVAGNALGNPQFALLDDSESVSGNQSVHFHAEGATQPAMLTIPLPANQTRTYVRAFVMSRIQVGGVPADQVSNHETLIGLRATTNDGNDEIRFGGAKGALGFNMVGPGRNDAVAPLANLWGSGPGMQAGQWHCVEIAFLNEGNPRAIASIDGTVVRDVDSPGGWHIPVAGQWLNGLYNEVIIGWQSFSNNPANDVWMDDVVLSTNPVGCN